MKDSYDLIVIGSGPGGEKAAIKAAYYGHSVAVVEKNAVLGGAGTNTGTLPSKTLKETALYFSGFYEKGLFGVDKDLERAATAQDFFFRKNRVVEAQESDIEHTFKMHDIDVFHGRARLVDACTVEVEGKDSCKLKGRFILIATGSYPFHPPGIPFDGKSVHDSDTILSIDRIPKSLVIVGAGVIGCEYATIFAMMGTKVTLVNSSEHMLTFLDGEIRQQLQDQMRQDGIEFVMGSRISEVTILPGDGENNVRAVLDKGGVLEADMFLYAAGRNGSSEGLNLEGVGVERGQRGTIVVDRSYRTSVSNIFAVGDVIGFPALASTSMDQGRVAVTHMFGLRLQERISDHFPYGIYTIPEVSVFGYTEEEAQAEGIPYVVGRARYADLPRGKIMGVREGMLKLVVEKHTRIILGVHIFGKIATELVHYGMSLVENRATLIDVVDRVYNTPTLHELYKRAAFMALVEDKRVPKDTSS
jgi:NAD(P) transhydrogenase